MENTSHPEAERARLQGLADRNVADKREFAQVERITGVEVRTNRYPMAEGSQPLLAALAAAASDDDALTDEEIIGLVSETFDLTSAETINRLAAIDFAAARASLAQAS